MKFRDFAFTKLVYPLMMFFLRLDINDHLRTVKLYFSSDSKGREKFRTSELKKTINYLGKNSDGNLYEMLAQLPFYTKTQLRDDGLGGKYFPHVRETAGTTGMPVSIGLSRADLGRQLAVRRFWFESLGVCYGEHEFRAWGRREVGIKSKLRNFILNRTLCNTIEESPDAVFESLMNSKASYIYGYSSMVFRLAQIFNKRPPLERPKLKVIICTAETLYPVHQAFIEKVFSCPCVIEYGSTEFDIIAFQCSKKHYHEASPWVVIEKVDRNIMVTDISRTEQPLLRYVIGDESDGDVIKSCPCGLGDTVFDAVIGRTLAQKIYFADGSEKHAVILAYAAEDFFHETNKIISFHTIQEEDMSIMILIDEDIDLEVSEMERMTECFKKYLDPLPMAVKTMDFKTKNNGKKTYFTSRVKCVQ